MPDSETEVDESLTISEGPTVAFCITILVASRVFPLTISSKVNKSSLALRSSENAVNCGGIVSSTMEVAPNTCPVKRLLYMSVMLPDDMLMKVLFSSPKLGSSLRLFMSALLI